MRARIDGVRRGPSATRPPSAGARASAAFAAITRSAPPSSASASASFMIAGYAAAAAALAVPRWSLPCATDVCCPLGPCVHRAARSRPTCASSRGEKANGVVSSAHVGDHAGEHPTA
eukprot:6180337-Pleurochrysis_carterae.AAC.1